MPYFSYHSGHSGQFCRHARGSLEEVVQQALAQGFTHYGLSEHCPRDRREDLYEDEAGLIPADLERIFRDYVVEAQRLREAYAGRIELLVGFETERLPPGNWEARMAEIRGMANFDYVLGSVHDVGGRYIDYSPEQTAALATEYGGREALEVAYFDAVSDLVDTLQPDVVGHLDLIRKFDGPDAALTAGGMVRAERALEAVKAAGAVLDVNCAAHRRGLSPVYPLPSLLERARRMGVGVTLGDDSHGPHAVGVGLDASLSAIAAAGYRELRYLARDGGVGAARWRTVAIEDVKPQLPASASAT
ncbi:MAG: histidinol-phosphatase [Myxococcales bacterium]|nr:histidinol-phosphatase [Myxococcales bacterium]